MTPAPALLKLVKKGQALQNPATFQDQIIALIAREYSQEIARELYFLACYYGLTGSAQTLESIGACQEHPLTRERVRQIIDNTIKQLRQDTDNPHVKAEALVKSFMAKGPSTERFLRLETLLQEPQFAGFEKNVKGLIAFLNDSNIRQIAYRKRYYFYEAGQERKKIVAAIQQENKRTRRAKTEEKMNSKSKTVTYVPIEVRSWLHEQATSMGSNLNALYEEILSKFIATKPYKSEEGYIFPKTQSWRARKGKAAWEQVGIYIDKQVFNNVKEAVKGLRQAGLPVSVMSFICQAFVWHWEATKA